MEQMGYGEQFSKLTKDSLKQMYKAVEVRLPQIDTELSNLQVKIKVQKVIIDKLNEQMKGLDEQQSKLIAGGYSAAARFGSGQAQIAAGKTQIVVIVDARIGPATCAVPRTAAFDADIPSFRKR